MGSQDDHPRKGGSKELKRQQLKSKIKTLLLILASNIITFFIFTGPFNWSDYSKHLPKWDTQSLSHNLNTTQRRLAMAEAHLGKLYRRVDTSNNLLEGLLNHLGRLGESLHVPVKVSADESDPLYGWGDNVPDEVRLVVSGNKLPLGFSDKFDSDEIVPPLGHACRHVKEDLMRYMDYRVGSECPVDDGFAQKLMLKGCEPLPRRRCHPKSPTNYVEPTPFPASLWSTPPDTSIIWDPYRCKSYQCLIDRKNAKYHTDCKGCFDLQEREKNRWLFDDGALDFGIDTVLGFRKPGTIRIGLDIGGGSGTFAARMREREVTIVTTSMNFDGPFNSFIASRGLVPMHMTVSHRLPFFENTLDIVHSMHVLSHWIPNTMFEFVLYDIYRVLRPGGLFWLDHFFCKGRQLNQTYVPMIGRIGFKRLRWAAGRKLDREANEWYISALLEKPKT